MTSTTTCPSWCTDHRGIGDQWDLHNTRLVTYGDKVWVDLSSADDSEPRLYWTGGPDDGLGDFSILKSMGHALLEAADQLEQIEAGS